MDITFSLIHLIHPPNNFTEGTQYDKHLGWRNEQTKSMSMGRIFYCVKKTVVYTHNGIAIKRDELLIHETTWMYLRITMLNV